jgi:parallel beta-helix repeat protein
METNITADDSSYGVRARARDGADNTGPYSALQAYNLMVRPIETTASHKIPRAFYNSSITSLSTGTFSFITGAGDTFNTTCLFMVKNITGTTMITDTSITNTGAQSISCSGTLDISGIASADGMYYLHVNVTDSDGDTVHSKAKVFYVCNSPASSGTGWTCSKLDMDNDGFTEGLNTTLYGDPNMTCDMCQGLSNWGIDVDGDGIDDVCDVNCGPINTSRKMISNLTATGDCIIITGDNITLDCDGFAIHDSGTGSAINITNRTGVTIKNCIIHSFSRAIHVGSSNATYLINNTMYNNTVGIFMNSSLNSTSYDNLIHSSPLGVNVTGSSSGNVFHHNNFTNNTVHADSVAGNSFNRTNSSKALGYQAEGNFWDDVSGLNIFDNNIDGYGETGPQHPYSAAKGGNVMGAVQDWGPFANKTVVWTNVTWPEGVYEPLCCGDGSQGENATCNPVTQDRYCSNISIDLRGTHKHMFEILFHNITAGSGNVSCDIQLSNGSLMTITKPHGAVAGQNVTLNYTLSSISPSAMNKTVPWRVKSCAVYSGSNAVYYNGSLDQLVYVHSNNWTQFILDEDGDRALDCYLGFKNRYFNNTRRCDWDGDLVWSYWMSKSFDLEGWCHDGSDNDGDTIIDCSDTDCLGIPYLTCPNATGYNYTHPPLQSPTCNANTNICYGSIVIGSRTVNYKYTQFVKPGGTMKVRFENGVITSGSVTKNVINLIPNFTAYGKYPGPGSIALAVDGVTSAGNASAYLTQNATMNGSRVDQVMYVNFSASVGSQIFELVVSMEGQFPKKDAVYFNVSASAPTNWNENDANLPHTISHILGTNTSNHACNDNWDNDLDYTTDCLDPDCTGVQIGVTAGSDAIRCESPESTCWDGFDNDGDGLVDCADPDCDGRRGAYYTASGIPVKQSTANATIIYCEHNSTLGQASSEGTNNYSASPSSCADLFDNDADNNAWTQSAFSCSGGTSCRGKKIDCYDPFSCWGRGGGGTPCPLREANCTDSIDNDFDVDLTGAGSNWLGMNIQHPNLDNTGADCDDYDCFGNPACPPNETHNSTGQFNASQCFDSIDNDLDEYHWNGSNYVQNISTGKDCSDPDCVGVTDPATGKTCRLTEFTAFSYNLANNLVDDDSDAKTDCLDNQINSKNVSQAATSIANLTWTDCWARFQYCGPCPTHENYTYGSCADGADNDNDNGAGSYDTNPATGRDCLDSDCTGEIGTYSGDRCVAANQENTPALCADSFDNDADGSVDCADPNCNAVGTCESPESTCNDGLDNDGDNLRDCLDFNCYGASGCVNTNTWTHSSCITVPNTASGAIGSGTGSYSHHDRLYVGSDYILQLSGSAANGAYTSLQIGIAENNPSWGKRFPYNTTKCTLDGPDISKFIWTPASPGYSGVIQKNVSSVGAFSVYLNCTTPTSPQPSRSYEIAFTAQPGNEIEKQTVSTRLYENQTPTVSKVEAGGNISANITIPYGHFIDFKAIPSDSATGNSGICLCDIEVNGTGHWTSTSNCTHRETNMLADDSSYGVRARARDGADNTGPYSALQTYNLMVRPIETTASHKIPRAFYNSSITSLSTGTFSFITGAGDTFGTTCLFVVENQTGSVNMTDTSITNTGAQSVSCSGTLDISGIASADGMYYLYVNVTDSDGDTVQSKRKVFYVCNSPASSGTGWTCSKLDMDNDGFTEGLNTTLYSNPNMTCDMCPGVANVGTDADADGIDDACDLACGDNVTTNKTLLFNLVCNGTALYMRAGVTLDCSGNSIIGNTTGFGVEVDNVHGSTISNCLISNFTSGVWLNQSHNTTISGTTVSSCGTGVHMNRSVGNLITGCTLSASNTRPLHMIEYFNSTIGSTTIAANSTFDNETAGSIRYTQSLTFTSARNLAGNVLVTHNYTRVRSSMVPEMNRQAIATLLNVSLNNPVIVTDTNDDGIPDTVCSACSIISYTNSTLVFTVPGFTGYSGGEHTVWIFVIPTNFTVKLTLDGTSNTVHVPGAGEWGVSQASGTWSSPSRWYVSSSLENVRGLVLLHGEPVSMAVSRTSANHSLTLNYGFRGSGSAVVFTRDDWRMIENRMPLIEAGSFLSHISPSFGYGLGVHHPIKILLEYSGVDVQSDLALGRGMHELVFESNRTGADSLLVRRA